MRSVIAFATVGCALLVVALGCVVADRALQRKLAAAETWPTAQGRVLESWVSRSGGRARETYPNVRFEYEVGGKRHVSERLHLHARHSMPHETCRWFVEQFPRGASVSVVYDPSDPATGVLRSDYRPEGISAYAFGALVAGGVGLIFLGIAWHKRRELGA